MKKALLFIFSTLLFLPQAKAGNVGLGGPELIIIFIVALIGFAIYAIVKAIINSNNKKDDDK